MMTETSMNLTPITIRSIANVKSPDSNIASCKARLEIIIKLAQDDYTKWKFAEIRGVAICNSIEIIKTKILQSIKETTDVNDKTLYTNELHKYCDQLLIVTTIFEDIFKNAKNALKQLESLIKLSGSCDEIFYRTWYLEHFIEFFRDLVKRYETETSLKKWVTQTLPHSMTRADMIHCICIWEYPQHVDSYVCLMFALLKQEINMKNV